MNNLTHVSMRLAAALLLQRGEISISDIKALPFVENDNVANAIVDGLFSIYHLERCQHQEPINNRWEDIFRLRYPVNDTKVLAGKQ